MLHGIAMRRDPVNIQGCTFLKRIICLRFLEHTLSLYAFVVKHASGSDIAGSDGSWTPLSHNTSNN